MIDVGMRAKLGNDAAEKVTVADLAAVEETRCLVAAVNDADLSAVSVTRPAGLTT
jgi:hypothetical protein